ncbi:hypothetical protein EC100833_3340, partial [Escherichia coli 10.0833]
CSIDKMCAAVDFVVAGRTCNGGNQVWRFDTGTAQSSQPDMCQYRRFRIAITYARDSYLAFPTTRCFSQISHDSSLLPVATIFYQPG